MNYNRMSRELKDLLNVCFYTLEQKDRMHPSVAVDNHKKISYFTKKKEKQVFENKHDVDDFGAPYTFFNEKLRQKYAIMGKVGKFFKHIKPELDNEEVKTLVSKWYSIIGEVDCKFEFELTKNIKKYYHYKNSDDTSGTLGGSCMNDDGEQDYIEFYDYYNVSLLILKNKIDKISGRALIWHDTFFPCLDKTIDFMDRIYTNDGNDEQRFIDYAIKNNAVYKKQQSYNHKKSFIYKDKEFTESITIETETDYNRYDISYPYVDTMSYMNDSCTLSNNDNGDFFISLECTDGNNSEENSAICSDCSERFDSDSEGTYIGDNIICQSCLDNNYFYCDCCNEWHHNDDNCIEIEKDGFNICVCQDCADNEYYQCTECGNYHDSDLNYEVDCDNYCNDCYHGNFTCCEYCNDDILNDDIIYQDDKSLCESCYDDLYQDCEKCGEAISKNDISDNRYCEDCEVEYQEESEQEKA